MPKLESTSGRDLSQLKWREFLLLNQNKRTAPSESNFHLLLNPSCTGHVLDKSRKNYLLDRASVISRAKLDPFSKSGFVLLSVFTKAFFQSPCQLDSHIIFTTFYHRDSVRFVFVSVLFNLWPARDFAIIPCCPQCLREGPTTLLQISKSRGVLSYIHIYLLYMKEIQCSKQSFVVGILISRLENLPSSQYWKYIGRDIWPLFKVPLSEWDCDHCIMRVWLSKSSHGKGSTLCSM